MKNNKTTNFATGQLDLSDDYLSRKAAGVEDDLVAVLPRSRISSGRVVLTGVLTGVAVTGIIWSASEMVKMALKRMSGNGQNGKLPREKTVRAAYLVKK